MLTRRHTTVLILILLALTACNLPGQSSVPDVVPTQAQPTLQPTATLTPEPSPTPQPRPIELVNEGERDLRNGNWDAALVAYQQVLVASTATPDERAAAQLGLAQISLRQGAFDDAITTLDAFFAEHAAHPDRAHAHFLRGDARLGVSNWLGAVEDYQTYLSLSPGLIDSYVYERIADAYVGAGQIDQALMAYDQATQTGRPLLHEFQLREKIATVNRSLGNPGGAITQYRAILEQSQNSFYRAQIEFAIGQTWFEYGEFDSAYRQFDSVFMTYPASFEAIASLRALLEAEIPVDQYQRGVVNFNQRQYDIAIQAFINHIASLESIADDDPLTHLYMGISYRRLGNTSAARSTLEGLIQRWGPSNGDAWADAHLELADMDAELGNLDAAYERYDQLVADYPTLPQAPEALHQAGTIAAANDDHTRAAAYFLRLAGSYPDDDRPGPDLFDLGIERYRAGDFTSAEEYFLAAVSIPTYDRPAAAHLWRGKTLQAAGRVNEAASAWNQAVQTEPTRYYGLRAAELLAGESPFAPPPNGYALPTDPDIYRADAEQWIITTFGLTETAPLADTLRGDIATDARLVRGQELWALGQITQAKTDFEALRVAYQDDPLAMYQLAIYFREIGLYRSSILSAARLHSLAGIDPLSGPIFIAQLRYPTYFSDLIMTSAEQYELDPLYVFSLIEQESLFEGFATSSASAQGLMQIWPPTGQDIAERINWPNYSTSDLQRAYINVAFGTWLLDDEFTRFGGDPYAVLAAYNAGSGNALNWQQASGGDPDLYVEVITLTEPYLYVTSIYQHYHRYRALYGTP